MARLSPAMCVSTKCRTVVISRYLLRIGVPELQQKDADTNVACVIARCEFKGWGVVPKDAYPGTYH